jgi:predicted TIM-barrel fold metal-dependent hydrolase
MSVTHFIDTFGHDKLVTSTDYPHGDSKFPHAVDAFDKLPMTDDAKAATVSTNWSELYKIPLVKQV